MEAYGNDLFMSHEGYPSIDFTLLDRPNSTISSVPESTAALLPDLHVGDSSFSSFDFLDGAGVDAFAGGVLRDTDEDHTREQGSFRSELLKYSKERSFLQNSTSLHRGDGDPDSELPSSDFHNPFEVHKQPVSNLDFFSRLHSKDQVHPEQQAHLSPGTETGEDSHDYYTQGQLAHQSNSGGGGWYNSWVNNNNHGDQTQLFFHNGYNSEASDERRLVQMKSGSSQMNPQFGFQSLSVNNDPTPRPMHSFLPTQKQSDSRQVSIMGLGLPIAQVNTNSANVIKSLPTSQALDYDGLLNGSQIGQFQQNSTAIENVASTRRHPIENNLDGQNSLHSQLQSQAYKFVGQNIGPTTPVEVGPLKLGDYQFLGNHFLYKGQQQGELAHHLGVEDLQAWQQQQQSLLHQASQHPSFQHSFQELPRHQTTQVDYQSQQSRQQQLQHFLADNNQNQLGNQLSFLSESSLQDLPRVMQPERVSSQLGLDNQRALFHANYPHSANIGNLNWSSEDAPEVQGLAHDYLMGADQNFNWQSLAMKASSIDQSMYGGSMSGNRREPAGQPVAAFPNMHNLQELFSGSGKLPVATAQVGKPIPRSVGSGGAIFGIDYATDVYDPENEQGSTQGGKHQVLGKMPFWQTPYPQSIDPSRAGNSLNQANLPTRTPEFPGNLQARQQRSWIGHPGQQESLQVGIFPQSMTSAETMKQNILASSSLQHNSHPAENRPSSRNVEALNQGLETAHYLQQVGTQTGSSLHFFDGVGSKQSGWNTLQMQQHVPQTVVTAETSANSDISKKNNWSGVHMQQSGSETGNSLQSFSKGKGKNIWSGHSAQQAQQGNQQQSNSLHLFTDVDARRTGIQASHDIQQGVPQVSCPNSLVKFDVNRQTNHSLPPTNLQANEPPMGLSDLDGKQQNGWRDYSFLRGSGQPNSLQGYSNLDGKNGWRSIWQPTSQAGGSSEAVELEARQSNSLWGNNLHPNSSQAAGSSSQSTGIKVREKSNWSAHEPQNGSPQSMASMDPQQHGQKQSPSLDSRQHSGQAGQLLKEDGGHAAISTETDVRHQGSHNLYGLQQQMGNFSQSNVSDSRKNRNLMGPSTQSSSHPGGSMYLFPSMPAKTQGPSSPKLQQNNTQSWNPIMNSSEIRQKSGTGGNIQQSFHLLGGSSAAENMDTRPQSLHNSGNVPQGSSQTDSQLQSTSNTRPPSRLGRVNNGSQDGTFTGVAGVSSTKPVGNMHWQSYGSNVQANGPSVGESLQPWVHSTMPGQKEMKAGGESTSGMNNSSKSLLSGRSQHEKKSQEEMRFLDGASARETSSSGPTGSTLDTNHFTSGANTRNSKKVSTLSRGTLELLSRPEDPDESTSMQDDVDELGLEDSRATASSISLAHLRRSQASPQSRNPVMNTSESRPQSVPSGPSGNIQQSFQQKSGSSQVDNMDTRSQNLQNNCSSVQGSLHSDSQLHSTSNTRPPSRLGRVNVSSQDVTFTGVAGVSSTKPSSTLHWPAYGSNLAANGPSVGEPLSTWSHNSNSLGQKEIERTKTSVESTSVLNNTVKGHLAGRQDGRSQHDRKSQEEMRFLEGVSPRETNSSGPAPSMLDSSNPFTNTRHAKKVSPLSRDTLELLSRPEDPDESSSMQDDMEELGLEENGVTASSISLAHLRRSQASGPLSPQGFGLRLAPPSHLSQNSQTVSPSSLKGSSMQSHAGVDMGWSNQPQLGKESSLSTFKAAGDYSLHAQAMLGGHSVQGQDIHPIQTGAALSQSAAVGNSVAAQDAHSGQQPGKKAAAVDLPASISISAPISSKPSKLRPPRKNTQTAPVSEPVQPKMQDQKLGMAPQQSSGAQAAMVQSLASPQVEVSSSVKGSQAPGFSNSGVPADTGSLSKTSLFQYPKASQPRAQEPTSEVLPRVSEVLPRVPAAQFISGQYPAPQYQAKAVEIRASRSVHGEAYKGELNQFQSPGQGKLFQGNLPLPRSQTGQCEADSKLFQGPHVAAARQMVHSDPEGRSGNVRPERLVPGKMTPVQLTAAQVAHFTRHLSAPGRVEFLNQLAQRGYNINGIAPWFTGVLSRTTTNMASSQGMVEGKAMDSSTGNSFVIAERLGRDQLAASNSSQIVHVAPPKKRKEFPALVPWRELVSDQGGRLFPTSASEIAWAAATNRIPDRDPYEEPGDGSDVTAVVVMRAKKRLRVTTHLMQELVPPVPAIFMRSNFTEDREGATYVTAKMCLSEACRLGSAACRIKSAGVSNDCGDNSANKELVVKEKDKVYENLSGSLPKEIMGKFKERVRYLDHHLQRLESLPSAVELIREMQEVERVGLVNRLANYHGAKHYAQLPDMSGRRSDSILEPFPKVIPQKYVTTVQMPSRLPEGLMCIQL